jgi:acyl carrier protein
MMDESKRLLAEALRIGVGRISNDTSMRDLPMWDSLGHMALIVLVEEHIGATLSMDEILAMTSLKGIAAVLEARRSEV